MVGAAARMQRECDGRQPGDPATAAQAILKIAGTPNPPLRRLALGSDAVKAISAAAKARADELERWRDLSQSTDF